MTTRGRAYEHDELRPSAGFAAMARLDPGALGLMLGNVLDPELPAGPPFTHTMGRPEIIYDEDESLP
jgi:hypothetical protein